MESENPPVLVGDPVGSRRYLNPPDILLLAGCVAFILPTMARVARDSWSTEQGGHGPLVLATGIWAVWRELQISKPEPRPGNLPLSIFLIGLCLAVFVVARITGILEVEAFSMYGALVSGAYLLF